MADFQEVLDRVWLALTWASPAEVQDMLEGLVKEQIISETYSRSLGLHQLTDGFSSETVHGEPTCKAGTDELEGRIHATHWHRDQCSPVRKYSLSKSRGSGTADHNQMRSEDEPNSKRSKPLIHGHTPKLTQELTHWTPSRELTTDKRYLGNGLIGDHQGDLKLDKGLAELLKGDDLMQMLASESEREDEGNFTDEEEWLELTEEAARRIAVPLWQHWDQGQRMLLPLVPCMTTKASENIATDHDASFHAFDMEAETELAVACRIQDLYPDNFKCKDGAITDTGLTLDTEGVTDALKSLFFSEYVSATATALTVDHFNISETAFDATPVEACAVDDYENQIEERVDSHTGTKMQELEQDGWDLPDDIFEFLNDDFEGKFDTDVLFGDPWMNCEDSSSSSSNNKNSDLLTVTELPGPDSHQQPPAIANCRSKRPRAPRSQQCTEAVTPRPKRQRTSGRTKSKEVQTGPTVTSRSETGSDPSPAETAGLYTPPPRILHLHPSSFQLIIPDTPGLQVVQALSLPPPVIRLPNTAAASTYILVPTPSPPCNRQVLPLSPIDGAVAPVQMSSSPPGSLSDTASKALSPSCISPISPSNEMSPRKESPVPQSPTVLDIPEVVMEYIQETKDHMSENCQNMEVGLSLTSHYVDAQIIQREILRSGKSTNKFLDKELIVLGETEQKKSILGRSQIFESSNGDKPKRYILLLGNVGMGKSTLIKKLCLDWSRNLIPQFDFVFLLDSKALTMTEPIYSLQTLLLTLSSFVPPCVNPEAVYAQMLAAPKRVLIIFDGFDELRDFESLLQTQEKNLIVSLQKDSKAQTYTVRQLYSAVLQRVLLPGCTLLLSTRPRGTATQLLRRADSLLEMCGFNPTSVESYLSQYFPDPDLRASAVDYLKTSSNLQLLCWNPGLCRLVCLVLEQSKSLEILPRTLTGLCHQVIHLKMQQDYRGIHSQTEAPAPMSIQSGEETQTHVSSSTQGNKGSKNTQRKSRAQVSTRSQRARQAKVQEEKADEEETEEIKSVGSEGDSMEERELLFQLSSLAWEGVKANSSVFPTGRTISTKLKAFSLRTGLVLSHPLRVTQVEGEGGGSENGAETGRGKKRDKRKTRESREMENNDVSSNILLWANPFLQSYLAGLHLSLSRTVSDRTFLQTLPFHSGTKGRRRPQKEELELTQRFAVGLLFHSTTELQRLHPITETTFRDMVVRKQGLVTKHLEGLSHADLSPAQVLEACHYVYEASYMHGDGTRDSGGAQIAAHLAANLPEVLTFHRVSLNPPDRLALQNILEMGRSEGRRFCLELEDTGIQISGLRVLVGLSNINTYRACIADVITLWEQLEESGEEELLQQMVSKFKIHPLKATQVCHIEHLAKLVNIHMSRRLSDSSSQSESILAAGVPAVKELHKLELGPEIGPLALPKLWELLPGLKNLQHLDLENSKIGDRGAEKLAEALVFLCSLEILNLSQNCIGDQGMKKLAATLRDLPKLHCLSLYSNVISDEGAESLAAVLPHMASLTNLDVKYNKLTDVGAQSLGASLRNCKQIKTLWMWNPCIPYGVFERLQQQDHRILWH